MYNSINVMPTPEVAENVLAEILKCALQIESLNGNDAIDKWHYANKTTRFEIIFKVTEKYPVNVFVWATFMTHTKHFPEVFLFRAAATKARMLFEMEDLKPVPLAQVLPLLKHEEDKIYDALGIPMETFDVEIDAIGRRMIDNLKAKAKENDGLEGMELVATISNDVQEEWDNGKDIRKLFYSYLVESSIVTHN